MLIVHVKEIIYFILITIKKNVCRFGLLAVKLKKIVPLALQGNAFMETL